MRNACLQAAQSFGATAEEHLDCVVHTAGCLDASGLSRTTLYRLLLSFPFKRLAAQCRIPDRCSALAGSLIASKAHPSSLPFSQSSPPQSSMEMLHRGLATSLPRLPHAARDLLRPCLDNRTAFACQACCAPSTSWTFGAHGRAATTLEADGSPCAQGYCFRLTS